MAKLQILAGATSQSCNVFIQDSSSTTGQGLAGLVFNTSNLAAYYSFTGTSATETAITLATLAAVNSAFSSGGFKELGATHMKGVYRLDIPDAALAAASGRVVTIILYGATNMAPCVLEIELIAWNNQVASIPNAVAGATGGIFIAGTNAATTVTTSFTTTFTGNLTGSVASVTGAVGSVTGLTASDVGAIKTKTDFLPSVVAGGAGGVFIAGANAATSITTALTANIVGNITGNLSGSVGSVTGAVGSVTGAVGSVTGNVGGNVTGSVGSVVGAVGSVTGNVGGNVVGTVGSVVGAVGSVTGAVGSVTGNVGGNVVGSVGSVVAGVTVSGDVTLTAAYDAAKTAAQAGDSMNVSHINGTEVQGDGSAGDPWGPV